jgi:hypothetical protein
MMTPLMIVQMTVMEFLVEVQSWMNVVYAMVMVQAVQTVMEIPMVLLL